MTDSPTRIYVTRGPGETRAALLAGDAALEVAHVRDAETQTGAIYAGRVGETVPGSSAVFVDLGIAPHGVLDTKGQKIPSGQLIAVEVQTPARADKGHKLARADMKIPQGQANVGLLRPAFDPVAGWWERHGATITEIIAEPASELRRIVGLLGQAAPVVAQSGDEIDFAEIEDQIEQALQPTVPLPSGGRVTIEQTAALVAVDIDAGASAIDTANAEAMDVIARHIRLRNLAGHIVIDLIASGAKQKFLNAFKAACAADPVETRVMGLTPSGMIDVVRRRTRPSLAETLLDPASGQLSAESVAYRALRLACKEMLARRVARIALHIAPAVAAILNERLAPALEDARRMVSGEIVITPRSDFSRARIDIAQA